MKCLTCKDVELVQRQLEPNLIVYNCDKCGGSWLKFADYWKWYRSYMLGEDILKIEAPQEYVKIEELKPDTDEDKNDTLDFENTDLPKELENYENSDETINQKYVVVDSKHAKLCPDCGRIMIKYKVSNNVNFYIDHCGNCNGVWLDKNEWLVLKQMNLHNQMQYLFTEPWQKKIREDLKRQQKERIYKRKLGLEDYKKAREIKEWLESKENREELIMFLMDRDILKESKKLPSMTFLDDMDLKKFG